MKLFIAGASPYSRKVLAAAIELGVADQLELAGAHPHEVPPELVAVNPLSKVPTLLTNEGESLYDSTAICLYLNSVSGNDSTLLPAIGPRHWMVWRRYSLANGMIDAAVNRRVEGWRSPVADRLATIAKQKDVCARVLDSFEADNTNLAEEFMLDSLTLACALGFLDFRFPDDRWREGRPHLTRWYDSIKMRPSLQKTQPYD